MGTVVMGKVESGSVTEGDSLLVMPNKVCMLWPVFNFLLSVFYCLCCDIMPRVHPTHPQTMVKVLAVYCDENKVRCAGPGENVRVRLSGIDDEDILSGFVLSSVGEFFLSLFSEVTNKASLIFDVVKRTNLICNKLMLSMWLCVSFVIFSSGSSVVDLTFLICTSLCSKANHCSYRVWCTVANPWTTG